MKSSHPCFNKDAKGRHGRVHLPVAPLCNIQCGYCDRRCACVNESRPGVAADVISPEEAVELALEAKARMPELSVAGIAGPGDPLAKPESTFETLRLLKRRLPALLPCLSTNGLALPDYADELARLGVRHLTITINAVDAAIGAKIYRRVKADSGWLQGEEGAAFLLERQLAGLRKARALGMTVKINTVIVPGINGDHAGAVARVAAALGANMMNCIAMLPVPGTPLGALPGPQPGLMAGIRARAEMFLPQMRHCGRCRADALGLIGGKMILSDLRGAGITSNHIEKINTGGLAANQPAKGM